MKLTVITPTFNSESTISRNIESVLNQEYSFLEHVIVDGGSSDMTMKIVAGYKEQYSQKGYELKFISEKDRGIYDAFNKGIELASGEIIGILNSDDWWPGDVARIVMNSINSSHDIYCGDVNLFDEYTLINRRSSHTMFLWLGMYVMHPSVFLKRSVYDKLCFTSDYKVAMDYDFLIRAKYKYNFNFKYVKGLSVNMSLGGNSSNVKLMRAEELAIIRKYLSYPIFLLVIVLKKLELFVFRKL